MKVSLVIPAYNEEKYIGECLRTALKHAPGLYEIIVVNNASTDRTVEVVRSFSGVKVVGEPTKGLTSARQRGFMEATGEILVYVDADTRIPQGWFEQILREFGKNQHLACLSGPYVYYDQSKIQQFFVRIYWVLAMPLYTMIGYMVVGGNFAIRASVLEKMNGFDTTIAFYGEDTNIARRASNFGKVLFSLTFVMYTSARRLSSRGFWYVGYIYIINFVSEAIFRKQLTREYEDIR